MAAHVRYLVFDIESVADGELVAKLRYGKEQLEPVEAIDRYRKELLEKFETDFIPYTYQIPVSIAVAKVDADCKLIDVVALDEPQFRSHIMTRDFWKGWEAYRRPTLVSFNGRSFDIPLLELAAFRYGLSLPGWFGGAKSYEQPRNRYNLDSHLDLHDVLTNFGASRFTGGLNLAANLLGKPGKTQMQGKEVQDAFNEGKLAEINDYCRCDVLDTYFVFLRAQVLLGRITLDEEQCLVESAYNWLQEKAKQFKVYEKYLEYWGSWHNPWREEQVE